MKNIDNSNDMTPLISNLSMFKTIMDHSQDSFYFKDRDFRFIAVSKNKAIRHGINDPSEMNGKTDFDFISESDAKRILEEEKSILETGQPIIGKIEKLTRLDGKKTWASTSKYPLYDENSRIIGIWGISRDITEYELAKEALRESEERYSQLSEQSRTFTWELDEQGLFIFVDQASEIVLGYRPDELVGKKHFYDLIPEEERKVTKQSAFDVFIQKALFQNLEFKTQTKDGHTVWLTINGILMLNDDGTLRGYRGSNTDITERKQAEVTIKESENHLIAAQQMAHVGNWELNLATNNIWASEESFSIYGIEHSSQYLPLKIVQHSVCPEYRKLLDRKLKNLIVKREKYDVEFKIKKANTGEERYVQSIAVLVVDEKGNPTKVSGTVQDITERKQTENALMESEKKYSSYIDNAPYGVMVHDEKGQYIEVNRASSEMTGYSKDELLQMTISDLLTEESQKSGIDHFSRLVETGSARGSLQHKHKDGTKGWWAVDAVKLSEHRFLGFVKDITDQKNAEEQVLYISYHDQLTGLYNRRFYEEELMRLDTKRNFPLTIVMGDVNGLKLINDSFGHAMGDELLKKAANVIKSGCRTDDIIARLGGDEFVALLPKTSGEDAELIISRINDLSRIERVGNIGISVSFGYATKSNEVENIQEIFKNAEDLMYRNKRADSSRVRSKTIDLVLNTLYKKSSREQLHSVNVSEICEVIATKMGLSESDVNQIKIAGLMHDIGKIEIDEKILNKPERLNNEEWEKMQRHPEIGYRILSSVNEFSGIADDILEHQERWDGKGYPRGLKGDNSSLHARIIAVADAYDAMTSDRTYDKAISEEEAIKEMRRCAGTQFDPDITRLFVEKVLGKEWVD